MALNRHALARACGIALLLCGSLDASPATIDTSVVAAHNAFGFNLLQVLMSEDQTANVLISPLSISLCLDMALAGAVGETRLEMAEALAAADLPPERLEAGDHGLLSALTSADPKVELAVANSLWARKGAALEPDFLALCRESYKARVAALDFSRPEAADTVNAWVSSATRGRIPAIVEELSPDDILLLVNAVYFKGKWQTPFDSARTREREFHGWYGTRPALVMERSGEFRYLERPGEFRAVAVLYAGGRFTMYLFLPRDTLGVPELVSELRTQNWQEWLAAFRPRAGTLLLPKFELEYENSLKEPLTALGMDLPFQPERADFSALAVGMRRSAISDVLHKTYIETDEQGTEAAAVTADAIGGIASEPGPPFRLACDRPFVCAVVDEQTGAVLFIGAIQDP